MTDLKHNFVVCYNINFAADVTWHDAFHASNRIKEQIHSTEHAYMDENGIKHDFSMYFNGENTVFILGVPVKYESHLRFELDVIFKRAVRNALEVSSLEMWKLDLTYRLFVLCDDES